MRRRTTSRRVAAPRRSVGRDVLTGAYDIDIHGPNGFLRQAAGNVTTPGVEASLDLAGPRLTLRNGSRHAQTVRVTGGAELNVPAQGTASVGVATDPRLVRRGAHSGRSHRLVPALRRPPRERAAQRDWLTPDERV